MVCQESNLDLPIQSPARYLYATAAGDTPFDINKDSDDSVVQGTLLLHICSFMYYEYINSWWQFVFVSFKRLMIC